MTLIEIINQLIAWRGRIVWAYMSENKQRKIAYFEIVLLIDKSVIKACAREGKDFILMCLLFYPNHLSAFDDPLLIR